MGNPKSDQAVESVLFHRPSLGEDPDLAGMPVDCVEAALALNEIAHDLGDYTLATIVEQPTEAAQ